MPPPHFVPMLIRAMRPRQWTKNLLLLAGLFFSHRLLDAGSVRRALDGFAIFCLLSGAVYLVNDVIDAPRDRRHPRKRLRPIAAGMLGEGHALAAALVIALGAMGWAYAVSPYFAMCALAYLLMMIAYSVSLKEVFLIDTMIIATGFIVRAVAGVIVLRTSNGPDVPLTTWFVVCVLFLSLLLAFCKRRSEKYRLEAESVVFRPVLGYYSPLLLDQAIAVSAAAAVLSYTLYATSAPSPSATGAPSPWSMLSTMPFVLFGILRYLHLVYSNEDGEAPETVLLTDAPLLGCIVLWVLAMLLISSKLLP